MVRKQQQQAASTPAPPKDKKTKRRQRAAAAAAIAAINGQASSAVEQGGQSNSSTSNQPASTSGSIHTSPKKHRRAANKPSQMSNDNPNTMYGEELPAPPLPRSRTRTSVKGKQKAVESNGNTGNMEDGEVDELDGLFFVDTAPGKLHRDVTPPTEKPVIAQRVRSISPVTETIPSLASTSRSRLPVPSALDDKVVPDYVGSSNEIKEADVVTDDELMQGSSRDLLNAIISHRAPGANLHEQIEAYTSKMSLAGSSGAEMPPANTSPSSTKRKRNDESAQTAERRASDDKMMLLDDLSTDESTTSEDEPKRQRTHNEQGLDDSQSEGESSGQEDNDATDNIALNMEQNVRTRPEVKSPQIPMRIDLTGSPPPTSTEAGSISADKDGRRLLVDLGFHDTTSVNANTADETNADADLKMDGVVDDEYQPGRSRYFKEDDPLKVCARCGETGHTVRDCVHLQCLTCGKLDDHGTRSCPLTMTCFRCNSRGHHIKDCPLSPEEARNNINQYCERCSSHTHKSSTCPYIWRVYIRAADAPVKPPKIHFACYNCASGDHFGDDCKFPRGHPVMSTERTAFTMDPDNHRKTHIRFDGNSASNTIPRPNIVNYQKETEAPPSHAPRGPRSMQQKAIREDRKKPQPSKKRESLEDVLYSLEQERRKTGDFGDLGDLEAGEIDEDVDAFEKRLLANKQQPKQPRGPKPGARDRRRARELGSKTNTDSSVNGDGEAEPKKSFQPFTNFKEVPPPDGSSLNRPRSMSHSPPPANRRRDARQASPIAMDSPAQARSAANWKKNRGLQDRLQSKNMPGRGGFASGSLLDRIDRGSASNDRQAPASRDPRDFPRREGPRDDYEGGRRDSRDDRRGGGDSYVPDGQARRGGNPRYRGGYF